MLGATFGHASDAVRRHPVVSTVLFCATRGAIGDTMAQLAEGRSSSSSSSSDGGGGRAMPFVHDKKRLLTFVTWTIGVGFTIDRYLYSHKFLQWFPPRDAAGRLLRGNVAKAVVFDNFFFTPLCYFPVWYVFKDCVMGAGQGHTPASAVRHYAAEAKDHLTASVWYWVPLQSLTFSVVPAHLRVAFLSVGATGYVAVLSYLTALLDRGGSLFAPAGAAAAGAAPTPPALLPPGEAGGGVVGGPGGYGEVGGGRKGESFLREHLTKRHP